MSMAAGISRFYRRFGLLLLLLALASAPFAFWYAWKEMETNHTHVPDWLPAGYQQTEDLRWFASHFVSDEILVLSWPGCRIDDACLKNVADRLLADVPQPGGGTSPAWFQRVFYGGGALDLLTSDPINLSRDEALDRLAGWIVGPDRETTCLVAMVSVAGRDNRHAAKDAAEKAAREACGLADDDSLHMGGPTVDSVEVDRVGVAGLIPMFSAAAAICIVVSLFALRSLLLTLVIFFCSLYNDWLALSLMYFTGQHMDAVLIVVPTLVFVLSISSAIHIVNYYLDAVRLRGLEEAAGRAVLDSLAPCCLAALTTAVGLGSLMAGKLLPIRAFGMYSAASIMASMVILYIVLPSFLEWFGPRMRRIRAVESMRTQRQHRGKDHPRLWKPLARFAIRCHGVVVILGIAALVVFGIGAQRINTSFKLQSLFHPESRISQDYDWLEAHLGGLIPVEVVLRFGEKDKRNLVQRLLLIDKVQKQIAKLPEVQATISAATFAPKLPLGSSARDVLRRKVLNRRLSKTENFQALINSGYLVQVKQSAAGASQTSPSPGENSADPKQSTTTGEGPEKLIEELWRITARVATDEQLKYEPFLRDLTQTVETTIRENTKPDEEIPFVVCGGVPLIDEAQRQLYRDLVNSFLLAFLLIALVMVVILRHISGAILSMLPNLFPVLLVFGMMGWLGIVVDIGAMMTASVALGIAVDDTVHFLTWFRRSLASGHGRMAAVLSAYRSCSAAMTQTTLVCGLGMLVYSQSQFVPISRFSWLLAISLAAALLGDLVLLPAMLVSPLGRIFGRKR